MSCIKKYFSAIFVYVGLYNTRVQAFVGSYVVTQILPCNFFFLLDFTIIYTILRFKLWIKMTLWNTRFISLEITVWMEKEVFICCYYSISRLVAIYKWFCMFVMVKEYSRRSIWLTRLRGNFFFVIALLISFSWNLNRFWEMEE